MTLSSAVSIFVKQAIKERRMPIKELPQSTNQMQTDGIEKKKPRKPVEFGRLKGKIWMSDDFDEPLDDFEEYM
jgi:antitoxin component of RelBE/YafQ-DinJ toxin-antitoxin module